MPKAFTTKLRQENTLIISTREIHKHPTITSITYPYILLQIPNDFKNAMSDRDLESALIIIIIIISTRAINKHSTIPT
jgi:hypothetical protein